MPEYIFIGAAVVSFANGLALLLVNPRRLINRIFFGGTILTCLWFFCLVMTVRTGRTVDPNVPDETLHFWLRMCSAVPAFIISQVAFMRLQLEAEITSFTRLLKKTWIWIVIPCFMAVLAFSEHFIPSHSTSLQRERGPAYLLFMALASGSGIWAIVDSLSRSRTLNGVRKLETQFFVFNSASATLLVLVCSLGATAFPEHGWLRRLGPICVSLWHGLTVWFICHHRIFDARHVVLSFGQRLLLLGFLGGATAGLVAVSAKVLGLWPSVMLASTTTGALALVCDRPMRRWFGLDSEHLLARPRSTIVEWARQTPGEEKLRHLFEGLLVEWCQTQRAILLPLRDTGYTKGEANLKKDWPGLSALSREGWVTPESLQRRREMPGAKACREFLIEHRLGALLAVPQGSPNPSLLIALGQKTSLRPYTYPDIQLLQELTRLMDNILTHSRMAAHAARLERMESAAMMSRGLAHDLNNLATPVSTFLLHMEPRVAPDTPEADVLRDAKHSVRVMQDYIRESLFFTRRLVPDFRPVGATELMQSVFKLTQARAQARGVSVVLENGSDVPFIADGALIQRLLQNLVFNGIDATPRGGTVTLTCVQASTTQLCFSIADEGPGVPASLKERIFDPYFTTKDTGDEVRGLGLGLAICRKICDLHHGEIEVGAAPDRGAVFTVKLPVAPQPSALLPDSKTLMVR